MLVAKGVRKVSISSGRKLPSDERRHLVTDAGVAQRVDENRRDADQSRT